MKLLNLILQKDPTNWEDNFILQLDQIQIVSNMDDMCLLWNSQLNLTTTKQMNKDIWKCLSTNSVAAFD